MLNRRAHSRAGNASYRKARRRRDFLMPSPTQYVTRSKARYSSLTSTTKCRRARPPLQSGVAEFKEMPDVFATGYLIGLMEGVCQLAIKPFLDWPREQSVGTHVFLSRRTL